MSYCRFGDEGSDVYVYLSADGVFTCCACSFKAVDGDDNGGSYFADTPAEMVDHLVAHRAAGERVPETAIEQLRGETTRLAREEGGI